MLNISAKIQIWHCCTVDLFFGVAGCWLDGRPLFAETLLGEFAVAKANLFAERSFSLVW
ncbi:hypothetical protein K2B98_004743 [Vibrio parahaemolyticus]|nr:hypothetical protein [Vibrio parahaemolyticus]EHY1001417.1 hypothetical protein [Vibrio parahaemolyticus]HBH7862228.1 hypothetical protein [Vibrio parahaemolyticus]HBH7904615.1 hypothetical protein [Vibrio parahaemolyticus]